MKKIGIFILLLTVGISCVKQQKPEIELSIHSPDIHIMTPDLDKPVTLPMMLYGSASERVMSIAITGGRSLKIARRDHDIWEVQLTEKEMSVGRIGLSLSAVDTNGSFITNIPLILNVAQIGGVKPVEIVGKLSNYAPSIWRLTAVFDSMYYIAEIETNGEYRIPAAPRSGSGLIFAFRDWNGNDLYDSDEYKTDFYSVTLDNTNIRLPDIRLPNVFCIFGNLWGNSFHLPLGLALMNLNTRALMPFRDIRTDDEFKFLMDVPGEKGDTLILFCFLDINRDSEWNLSAASGMESYFFITNITLDKPNERIFIPLVGKIISGNVNGTGVSRFDTVKIESFTGAEIYAAVTNRKYEARFYTISNSSPVILSKIALFEDLNKNRIFDRNESFIAYTGRRGIMMDPADRVSESFYPFNSVCYTVNAQATGDDASIFSMDFNGIVVSTNQGSLLFYRNDFSRYPETFDFSVFRDLNRNNRWDFSEPYYTLPLIEITNQFSQTIRVELKRIIADIRIEGDFGKCVSPRILFRSSCRIGSPLRNCVLTNYWAVGTEFEAQILVFDDVNLNRVYETGVDRVIGTPIRMQKYASEWKASLTMDTNTISE